MPKIIEHEEHTTATREQVWAQWADVESWPNWDENLEWVKAEGILEDGTFARLKPKGAKVVAFEFVEVDAPNRFVDITLLPKAKMHMEHRLTDAEGGGLTVYQRVSFSGLLGGLFGYIIGRGMKRDMPGAMRKMISLAEAS
ncbi:MAG: SRPBCC family protein [Solirubrobacterales bacterium]|nr:SRPBCC family protein [Solirubrobacterales bacterium]